QYRIPFVARPTLQIGRSRHARLLAPASRTVVFRIVEEIVGPPMLDQARLVEPAPLPLRPLAGIQARRLHLPPPQVVAPAETDHRRPALVSRIRVRMVHAQKSSPNLARLPR